MGLDIDASMNKLNLYLHLQGSIHASYIELILIYYVGGKSKLKTLLNTIELRREQGGSPLVGVRVLWIFFWIGSIASWTKNHLKTIKIGVFEYFYQILLDSTILFSKEQPNYIGGGLKGVSIVENSLIEMTKGSRGSVNSVLLNLITLNSVSSLGTLTTKKINFIYKDNNSYVHIKGTQSAGAHAH